MGGALITLGANFFDLLLADIGNRYVLLALLATVGSGRGRIRRRLFEADSQEQQRTCRRGRNCWVSSLIAFVVALALYLYAELQHRDRLSFHQNTFAPDLGVFYIPFAMLVIVGRFQCGQSHRRA